jgi:hypothetical protein
LAALSRPHDLDDYMSGDIHCAELATHCEYAIEAIQSNGTNMEIIASVENTMSEKDSLTLLLHSSDRQRLSIHDHAPLTNGKMHDMARVFNSSARQN